MLGPAPATCQHGFAYLLDETAGAYENGAMRNGRRDVLAWAVGAFGAACTPAAAPAPRASSQARKQADPFAPLEAATGGHLGVAAIDLHTGAEIGHRADQRFAMCSTFKWVLAARTLAAVDPGELSLT